MNGVLTALGGVVLGAFLGWFLVRSRFSLARVFCRAHAGEKRDWVRAYLLGLALVWLGLGAGALLAGPGFPVVDGDATPTPNSVGGGLYAAALGGVLAGLAFRVLGSCTLTLLLAASGLRLPALVAVAGWTAGVLAVAVGPAASVLAPLIAAGPVPGWAGMPLGPVLVIAGAVLFGWLQRVTVSISPEKMEWPKQGALLAVLALAGWALGFAGGEPGGLNGVTVVGNLAAATAVAGGGFFGSGGSGGSEGSEGSVGLSFFVATGLLAFGAIYAMAVRRGLVLAPQSGPASARVAVSIFAAAGGGFLLGIASGIGGGNPAAHAFAGIGLMKLDSVVFVAAMWGVGWVTGIGGNKKGGS